MDSVIGLLDRLEAVVLRGTAVPLSDKRMVDVQEVLGLLRMVRAQLPGELHRAQRLREEAEALHQRATDEARRIIGEAEAHARHLMDDGPVVAEAERRRTQLVEEGEAEAARVRHGSEEYAAQVLADLEAQVARILDVIRRGKTMLDRPGR